MIIDLSAHATQAQLAIVIGVSQQNISALVRDGALPAGCSAGDFLLAYCRRLREQAAGRLGEGGEGGLDLVQERAALARAQRESQELKNAVARGEYAPVGLLSDVLGVAGSAVVDRLDQLEGVLRKSCPDLPAEAVAAVMTVVASARNEWVRAAGKLAIEALDSLDGSDDFALDGSASDDGFAG